MTTNDPTTISEAVRNQPARPGDEKFLKIENSTNWHTGDLKRFALACCRSMGISPKRTLRVERARKSDDFHHGYGYYHSRTACLRIPNPEDRHPNHPELPIIDWKKAAQILEHEFEHNLGLKHRHMAKWWKKPVPWLEGLTFRACVPTAKPTLSPEAARLVASQEREARAVRAVERWERRVKLAKARLAGWKKKVHYYERKRAASPQEK